MICCYELINWFTCSV